MAATAMKLFYSMMSDLSTNENCMKDLVMQHNNLELHCRYNLAAKQTILFPPLTKTVTAREFLHSSITSIRSLVVPNDISLTTPALPSFSEVSSENLGTIRPPVAMAISYCKNESVHFLQKFSC